MATILANARIIDGKGAEWAGAYVVLDDGKIAEIGQQKDAPDGGDHEVVDLGGKTLMPGVIDCHVHLSIDGAADALSEALADTDSVAVIRMIRNAERTLAAGVTTVRDVGAKSHIDFSFRNAVWEGVVPFSPRLVLSGTPVTMVGGHFWQMGREASGEDETRKAAREQLKAGADCVKLMATGGILTEGTDIGAAQLDEAEMRAAVEEAHKAGKIVAAHAHGTQGIKNAVRAGVDSVEHGYFLDDECKELMLDRETYLVATAAAVRLVVEHGIDAGIPCPVVRKAASALDTQVETCRDAWKGGIRLAMGTDAGTPFNHHGDNMQELETMVEHIGLSPMEAIVMATTGSARLLGLEERIGSVEPGKDADLIIVDGDPLANISVLRDRQRIDAVYQDGNLVARHGEVVRAA